MIVIKKYHYVFIKVLNRLITSGSLKHGNRICEQCWKRFSTIQAVNSKIHKCNYENNNIDLPENMYIEDNKLYKLPINAYVKPYNLKHNQV